MSNINYIPVGALFKPDPVTGITYYCQGAASATCVAGAPPSGAIPDFRPWGYNQLYVARHGSYSNYNGLIVQWMKQTGRAVFNVNYAWSHTLGVRGGDNDNGQGSGAALDAFKLANNYGTLAFDRRHIFNAAYVLNLPSPIHNNLFGQEVVNGWQLTGTVQYQSGPPLQPLTGKGLNATFAAAGGNNTNPDTNGKPAYTVGRRTLEFALKYIF